MISLDQRRLLSRISEMYYLQDLTQAEIAGRVNLSRQKVQRMIRQARDSGVVRISIEPIAGGHAELERELESKLGLREVVIVDTADAASQSAVARDIGAAAQNLVRRVITPGGRVVISWGGTLLGLVNALEADPQRIDNVSIVQGLGGLGDPMHDTHAADLTRRLAGAIGGRAVLLPVPGVAASRGVRNALLKDPQVEASLAAARSATVAIMGIGVPRKDSILINQGRIVTWPELQDLASKGATGDINLRFFDAAGRAVKSELDARVIGLTLEEIAAIPNVIAIAGGRAKVNAIRAAIRGKLFHMLVTDHETAKTLAKSEG